MSYIVNVYNVMLASPSDVIEELNIAKEVISEWNCVNSNSKNIVLLPINWEYNSFSSFGDRPQEIINNQLLKNADLLIGIFWTRIGTPTGKAISGTVEEIEEHIKSGKPTMLYFSNRKIEPSKIDDKQYKAVLDLKTEYQTKGVTHSFDSVDDFRSQFHRQLPLLINSTSKYFIGFEEQSINSFMELESADKLVELSKEAKILLVEGSIDSHGRIMKLSTSSGFIVQTNHHNLNQENSPRSKAKWEAVFDELIDGEFIRGIGFKGEVFELTAKGFELADKLKSEPVDF
jgi:hypothetical protein